jgi:hypothetical protein
MAVKSEDRIQAEVIIWRNNVGAKLDRRILWLYHIRNGGALVGGGEEGAYWRLQGITAGIADLCLPIRTCDYGALYIELKTSNKSSKQAAAQKKFEEFCLDAGNKYVVCRNSESAIYEILRYLSLN